ncbi:MAG: hypothetical protein HXX15_19495 [Rhodopseudomonas sp.]|uniref:hypothetical protein n=1 Tax=Rhodopseudomonas sp. TaxID=1078 RepID=UPI0017956D08|nr:hypothetical protein [Rhodopseudomonas sp.]NVN88270.1 hypothetical protein [Rhodopseudomonas sp.]
MALKASRFILLFRIAAFVPIVAGCIVVLYFMPSVPSIAVLTATVESMSFTVVVPEMARLQLHGYALSYEAATTDLGFGSGERIIKSKTTTRALCLEGLVTPEPGTKITYERFGADPVAVELRRDDGNPVGKFEVTKGAVPEALQKASWVRLVAPKSSDDDSKPAAACAGTPVTRLPVYGFADIGSEIRPLNQGERPSFGTLLDGTIDIFARTIQIPFLNTEPRIYPANTTSITVPPGSRVTLGGPVERRKPWVGFAMPDAANSFGLDVRLTTEAKSIALVRPGVGLEPEILAVGLFTQLTNDPTLMTAQVIAAVLFSVFQILGSVASWAATHRDNRRDDEDSPEAATEGNSAALGSQRNSAVCHEPVVDTDRQTS